MSKAVMTQMSTTWCGPCKMAKKYIEEKYPDLEYNFVDLEGDELSDRDKSLAMFLQVRGVPHFAVTSGNHVIDQWTGFNREKIDSNAEAIKNGDYDNIDDKLQEEE